MDIATPKQQELETYQDYPCQSFSDRPVYDQRYLPRWQTSQGAFYRIENDNVLVRTQLKDLTFSGASLYTNEDVRVNDRLEMKISLSRCESFQARGIILWKKSNKIYSYAGILFDKLDEDIQGIILEHGFVNHSSFDGSNEHY